jgi:hypothetical protein
VTKRMMELMTKVACHKEGNDDGYKSNGDEGDGRATAMRVMVMAKGNSSQPAMGATKAGGGWQESLMRQSHEHDGGQQQTTRACGR